MKYEMSDYERIKNFEQINWYLSKLKLPIKVGMTRDKIFYVSFEKTERYLRLKEIWMKGSREGR